MHRRTGWLLAIATLVGMAGATTASAAQPPGDMDRRGVREAVTPAREALDARLGPLTGPSSQAPEDVALGYVRAHPEVFGLSDGDLATLKLVARDTSPDGITHLRFNQVLDGIESYDRGLNAHVTRDGRLVSLTGAPLPGAALPTTAPKLSSGASLAAARSSAGGSGLAPAVDASAKGRATFTTGESARLQWTATDDGVKLTWAVQVDGADGDLYLVQVDAADGTALTRTTLTDHLGQAKYFKKDPDAGAQVTTTMPAAWYDDNNGGTRLWGQFARTYDDSADVDPAPGAEGGPGLIQIPESTPGSRDWLYDQSHAFPGATPCPTTGCTWNSATPSTAATNRFQAATNAHVLVSRFHDHLAQPPIGFDEASGNFQRVNGSGAGKGGDYVRVEVNDGEDTDNADFATPPDGTPGRMQMFLFTVRDTNGSDVADIVYHEYGHGLSNRLIVYPGGASALASKQGLMMGEAWSDFYALDLLNAEGSVPDTAAPGEVTTGSYVLGGGGVRAKAIDCPVDPGSVVLRCNGYAGTPVTGGYTYGDLAGTNNTSPHNGGEVWAETLWDLRAAVGRIPALALVTGGMRLSPPQPSMLDMRDAILRQAVAMRSAPGAADDYYAAAWAVFAARGMGEGATTPSADSTTPHEDFALPSGLEAAGAATVTDPYPDGDADGIFEPGETVSIAQPLTGRGLADLPGVTGTLTSATPGATVLDGTAAWPLLGRGRSAANADALIVKLPASCTTPTTLSLAATSPGGGATTPIAIETRPADGTVVPIADQATTTATFRAYGTGAVTDIDVRLDELLHSFVGDLVVKLSHDGVTATVFDPTDSLDARGLIGVVVDDEAVTTVPTSGTAPLTGRYRPPSANALAAFDGHPVAGTWTLTIIDQGPGDAGVLRRWGLDGPQVACSPVEIPAADTADAGDVTTGSATARGSVTPNGRATGLRFAYGTTTAYGSATATQDVGSGTAAVAGTAALTGLQPGTTYHVRAEAIRENGVVAVTGPDRTFTTAPPPAQAPPSANPPATPKDITKPSFVGKPKVALAKPKKGKRAATATFALSEAATVRATLTRRTAGLKSGSKCVKKTAKRRKGKACARYVPTGKPVSKAFTTTTGLKLALGSLKKGTYVVTLTATDKAGNTAAKPATVTFTVR